MKLKEILKEKNISIYSLSKYTNIPYSTLSDLCNDKINQNKMSLQNAYNIANALDIKIETLLEEETQTNIRSRICHELSKSSELDFIIKVLEEKRIDNLYKNNKMFECYYTLALIEYLCHKNNVDIDDTYKTIKKFKFNNIIYPSSVDLLLKTKLKTKKQIIKESIPEFMKYNIVENNIYDSI